MGNGALDSRLNDLNSVSMATDQTFALVSSSVSCLPTDVVWCYMNNRRSKR